MSRPYVFLIHGVGNHPSPTWADGWKTALVDELRRYAPFSGRTQAEIEAQHVRFVPIGYDAVFEGFRRRWANLAKALEDNELIQGREAIQWVANNATAANGFEGIFWEKVLDVLLWASVPLARAAAIANVAEQLTRGISEMLAENGNLNDAHCIAHSLGTSLLHDALVSLTMADSIHGGVLDPAHFRWQSISMVANTSRLLRARKDLSGEATIEDFKPYTSILRPGLPRSITNRYLNIRHQLDPITWPKKFDPFDWDSNAYSELLLSHFHDARQVHDFAHYVTNPKVHLPLWRTILSKNFLGTKDEVNRVSNAFVQKHPKTSTALFEELRRLSGDDSDSELSAKDLVKFLVHAFKELT